MYKYALQIILAILSVTHTHAQQPAPIVIKDPGFDTALQFIPRFAAFQTPHFILNSEYVIFQKSDSTRVVLKEKSAALRFPRQDYTGLFALCANGVYFNGDFIAADTTGFSIAGELQRPDYRAERQVFWKTRYRLFLNTTEVKDEIDIPSFKTAYAQSGEYFKDKDFIYYKGKKINGSHSASASETFDNMMYDKNYVYINGVIALYEGDTLRPVNHWLVRTSKFVLTRQDLKVQPQMDAKTIRPLSRYCSCDKNHIYVGIAKTNVLVRNLKKVKVWDQTNSSYITDGTKLYAYGSVWEPGLDAATFGMLPFSDYIFDKNGIYEREWKESAQKVINKKFPFNYTKPVSEKNIFLGYAAAYLLYENQAYDLLRRKLYTNLTPLQVKLVKENKLDLHHIDKKRVFHESLYEAGNTIYHNGKATTADAPTFEPFHYFFKDKNHLYQYNQLKGLIPVEGPDVKTLTTFNDFWADKDYIYSGYNRIIRNEQLELLGTFTGYRPGCGLDKTPSSDYYLFKNAEGYWLALVSADVRIKKLGTELDESFKEMLGCEDGR
jgi:hypothetical protein